MKTQDLTNEQIGAIIGALRLGRTLQRDIPEIREDYRSGSFMHEIIDQYDIENTYDITHSVAKKAVSAALHGHVGGFQITPYDGLLEKSELERLASEHLVRARKISEVNGEGIFGLTAEQRSANSLKIALSHMERGIGITALSKEELSEIGRKNALANMERGIGVTIRTKEQMREDGLKGGKACYEKGIGVHAMTTEQRRAIAMDNMRKGLGIHSQTIEDRVRQGRKAAITNGYTPWIERTIGERKEGAYSTLSEVEFAHNLSLLPEYRRGSLVRTSLIAQELNEVYHGGRDVRSERAVTIRLRKYRKGLRK